MKLDDDLIWRVRAFIYAQFAQTALPPSIEQTAQTFDINPEQAASLYRELNDRHAIFLEPGTLDVRMAFPFSGIPTDFRVVVNGKKYWANCAWDMLGIPAALHSSAAAIDAKCAESGEPLRLELRDGAVLHSGVRIHFAVPFARWYEDLPHT